MSKVLILDDGVINEYEVNYDQEYMNFCLEEYRMKHAYLTTCYAGKKGKCSDSVPVKTDVVYDNMKFKSNIISAVNPAVYSILYDIESNGFELDSFRMFTLMAWYKAVINSVNTRKEELPSVNGYQNIDEKIDIKENITDLLSDVSLNYIGPSDSENQTLAKVNASFVSEFNISKNKSKIKSLVK